MNIKPKKILSFVFLSLFLPSMIFAVSKYDYVIEPDTDIYFGHISLIETSQDGQGPVIIKEGQERIEAGVLNFPIAPGDTIRTRANGKCEIQFDTGTILRLDSNSVLKVETILAQSLSSREKITSFYLQKGQIYIMYKQYVWKEMFQIITPNAAVKMNHKSVALVSAGKGGETDIQVEEGGASVLFGPGKEDLKTEKIKRSQHMTIGQDDEVAYTEEEIPADFQIWNEHINKNFKELHEGKSFIPKPIQRMPKAVFEFAQKFSTSYGEWLWDELYGYVWRPHLNENIFGDGKWQPYVSGQWTSVNGHLFWVPGESWGWVPYHLGLWVWNEKKGWIWLPGSHFAPAWVAWSFFTSPFFNITASSFFSWRPLTFYDYCFDYKHYSTYMYEGTLPIAENKKDKLEKEKIQLYPLPKNLKEVRKRMILALKQGNKEILASLEANRKNMVFVKQKDLNTEKLQERAVSLEDLPIEKQGDLSLERIIQPIHIIGLKSPISDAEGTHHQNKSPFSNVNDQMMMRFRDWNPDIKAARRAGVSIVYSSRTNEVLCPEWGLSSRNVRIGLNSQNTHSLSSYHSGSWSSSVHLATGSTRDTGASSSSGGISTSRNSQETVKK